MDFQVCQPQKTRVLCHLKQDQPTKLWELVQAIYSINQLLTSLITFLIIIIFCMKILMQVAYGLTG